MNKVDSPRRFPVLRWLLLGLVIYILAFGPAVKYGMSSSFVRAVYEPIFEACWFPWIGAFFHWYLTDIWKVTL